MAKDAFRAEQPEELVDVSWVVDANREFDMSTVAGAAISISEVACGAAVWSDWPSGADTHRSFLNDPRAGSWRPPGFGCSSVLKVFGLTTLLTDSNLTSVELRKSKSTPDMWDTSGLEMFILGGLCRGAVHDQRVQSYFK